MAEQLTIMGVGGLRVIGAGFGRTGTLSLKAALEELGFGPCYHMTELFQHPDDLVIWKAASRGETVDWKTFLAGYAATVDWPGCTYYKEMMQAFPDAKVLLTVRDFDKWYESANATIFNRTRRFANRRMSPLRFIMMRNPFVARRLQVGQMINEVIWGKTFGGNFEDKASAQAVFNEHIEEVKQAVPPEKLLIYNVKEGWEPLCAFLGVPVPVDTPFPHLNDRESFGGDRFRKREQRITVGTSVGLGLMAVLGAFFLLRRMRK